MSPLSQKEAAWAISNATSGGNDAQIRYLADQGVIPRLCELFTCPDSKIIMVAMEGVENILRVGKADAQSDPNNVNAFADQVEQCKGLDYLEALQHHENADIYQKAAQILQTYFISEDDEEGEEAAPQQTDEGFFAFNQQQGQAQGGAGQGGFTFGS